MDAVQIHSPLMGSQKGVEQFDGTVCTRQLVASGKAI